MSAERRPPAQVGGFWQQKVWSPVSATWPLGAPPAATQAPGWLVSQVAFMLCNVEIGKLSRQ